MTTPKTSTYLNAHGDYLGYDGEAITVQEGRRKHVLSLSDVDELDEISNEAEQCCVIWCKTHRKYEFHCLPGHLVNPNWPY